MHTFRTPAAGGIAACHTHPHVPSTTRCTRCLNGICGTCTDEGSPRGRCVACARRERRGHAARVTVVVAGVLAVFGGLAFVATTAEASKTNAPAVGTGGETATGSFAARATASGGSTGSTARRLEEALEKEPCDRGKIIELGDELLRAGENRRALQRSDVFLKTCGDHPRLRWVTYEAHRRLSEWEPAIAEASKLIESSPDDLDYWVWRGLVYESKGDLERAAADFRQALAIDPSLLSIPLNLANVYERSGRPCEGIAPLEQLVAHHGEMRGMSEVSRRIDRLYADERCASLASIGRATIRTGARGDVIRTNVVLNGNFKVKMVVDTGASSVSISRTLAERMGIAVDRLPTVRLRTAGGTKIAHEGQLDEVKLRGITARKVALLVVDDLAENEGLLGQSFLSRFTMTTDAKKGTLELAGRQGAR